MWSGLTLFCLGSRQWLCQERRGYSLWVIGKLLCYARHHQSPCITIANFNTFIDRRNLWKTAKVRTSSHLEKSCCDWFIHFQANLYQVLEQCGEKKEANISGGVIISLRKTGIWQALEFKVAPTGGESMIFTMRDRRVVWWFSLSPSLDIKTILRTNHGFYLNSVYMLKLTFSLSLTFPPFLSFLSKKMC